MITNHHQSTVRFQYVLGLLQKFPQRTQLVVYFNSDGLIHLRQVLHQFTSRCYSLSDCLQVYTHENFLFSTLHDYFLCQGSGIFDFTIRTEKMDKILLFVGIDNLTCRQRLIPIHAHIKFTVPSGRKTTLRNVKLMRRNAQIRQNSIYSLNAV